MTISNTSATPIRPLAGVGNNWLRDLAGIAIILAAAVAGYFLFPNNLALLTRMIAIRIHNGA